MSPPELHLIVPGSIEQRTGGYLYDARMAAGLRRLGWRVEVHELEGGFPDADARARASLEGALAGLPDGARALIDGLALGGPPAAVRAHAPRLRALALVHHPLADETGLDAALRDRLATHERAALAACAGALVTSAFTATRLDAYGVPAARVRAVPPGTEPARPAQGPGAGAPPLLLCVGTLSPRKGQDVLVKALARVAGLGWRCVCAGSAERDPAFAASVRARIADAGLDGRVELAGECGPEALDALYHGASLFVLPSWYEGYGMALAEAVARGLPVVSTTGGAIPHTVPADAALLVPPGDDRALADALAALLAEPGGAGRRARLAAAARRRSLALPGWDRAAAGFARALLELVP